jgi:hypothetical protein
MKWFNTSISSAHLFLALVASALVGACSGKSTAGSGSSRDTAPPSGDGAPSGNTHPAMPPEVDASEGGTDALAVYVVPVATQLLDDGLVAGTDGPGTAGDWLTYSDRSVPYSEPATLVANASGILVPPESAVLPTSDDAGPTYRGSICPYRRFSGGGEVLWGAGMLMFFSNTLPDGGPVPMNACDAGAVFDVDAAGMDSVINLPFDASGWTGIQFWAKSLVGYPRTVSVIVDDDRTNPFGLALDAGGCNVCANFTQDVKGYCGDGPQTIIVFAPTWTHVQLPFASMHPSGYSGEPTTWTPHTNALFAIQFQLTDVPLAPFDLAVAYVELYK